MWDNIVLVKQEKLAKNVRLFLCKAYDQHDIILTAKWRWLLWRFSRKLKEMGYTPHHIGKSIFYGHPAILIDTMNRLRDAKKEFAAIYCMLAEAK